MKCYATALLFALTLAGVATPAHAGQAEARDTAMSNNCAPKKIEVYQQSIGSSGDIVYRVQCALPKSVGPADTNGKPPDALLIQCTQSLCNLLRAIKMEDK